ncbi:hypothetical protein A5675_11010 [Mycobacterium malmoense]|nr:hypothetical protein A5675_11010 [Mycobacterium malmoense]
MEAMQRAEVERIAGKSVQKPTALWSAGIELTELLTDTGTVDPTKVATAVQTARDTLGLAPVRPAGYVGAEGRSVDQPTSSGDPWKDAFKG